MELYNCVEYKGFYTKYAEGKTEYEAFVLMDRYQQYFIMGRKCLKSGLSYFQTWWIQVDKTHKEYP